MDSGKWNITNSAQNIVSALVDPSKQYDDVFRREWANTFSSFSRNKLFSSTKHSKHDAEFRIKLKEYVEKLESSKRLLELYANDCKNIENQSKYINEKFSEHIAKIPIIFRSERFNLSACDTFNSVIDAQTSKISDTSHLRTLQKRYTDYLDLIEEMLASQISNRSGDFFQVMSSVDSVMDELCLAIKCVTNIREKCESINNELIAPHMKNISLVRSKQNLQIILSKMIKLSNLFKVQQEIQLLLAASDYSGALDLISTSRLLLEKEFKHVICIRHLRFQLDEVEKNINFIMHDEFVNLITSEWNRPLDTQSISIKMMGSNNVMTMDVQNLITDDVSQLLEADRILSIVQGLIRMNNYDLCHNFEDEAIASISTCMKQTLIELLSNIDDEFTNRELDDIYEMLKHVSNKKWIFIIQKSFENMLSILNRVKMVYKVICAPLDEIREYLSADTATPNNSAHQLQFVQNFTSTTDIEAKQSFLANLKSGKDGMTNSLLKVCGFSDKFASRLIEVRIGAKNFDKLIATEFMNLSQLIEDFSYVFMKICGNRSPCLLPLLENQANLFVTKFHDEHKNKIESNLKIEQWKSVTTISTDFKDTIRKLVDEQMTLVQYFAELNDAKRSSSSSIEIQSNNHHSTKTTLSKDGDGFVYVRKQRVESLTSNSEFDVNKSKCASSDVDIRTNAGNDEMEFFVIVNSVINLIQILLDYCKCANDIRSVSEKLFENLLELLEIYNSSSYNLVAKNGATQKAGLKTITTRNLILTQRSLKLVLLLIPSFRQHFEHLLLQSKSRSFTGSSSSNNNINNNNNCSNQTINNTLAPRIKKQFDKVFADYANHINEIPSKVLSNTKLFINEQLSQWKAKPPVPSEQFVTILNRLKHLHENVEDIMPPNEFRELLVDSNGLFKLLLTQRLKELHISNDTGPQQWLVFQELTHYKVKCKQLRVFMDYEFDFSDIWNDDNDDDDDDDDNNEESGSPPAKMTDAANKSKNRPSMALPQPKNPTTSITNDKLITESNVNSANVNNKSAN